MGKVVVVEESEPDDGPSTEDTGPSSAESVTAAVITDAANVARTAESVSQSAAETAAAASGEAAAAAAQAEAGHEMLVEALATIRAEMDDLRAALRASLAEGQDDEKDDLAPEVLTSTEGQDSENQDSEDQPAPRRFGSDRWFGNR
jgi:hypothetical protein